MDHQTGNPGGVARHRAVILCFLTSCVSGIAVVLSIVGSLMGYAVLEVIGTTTSTLAPVALLLCIAARKHSQQSDRSLYLWSLVVSTCASLWFALAVAAFVRGTGPVLRMMEFISGV